MSDNRQLLATIVKELVVSHKTLLVMRRRGAADVVRQATEVSELLLTLVRLSGKPLAEIAAVVHLDLDTLDSVRATTEQSASDYLSALQKAAERVATADGRDATERAAPQPRRKRLTPEQRKEARRLQQFNRRQRSQGILAEGARIAAAQGLTLEQYIAQLKVELAV